MDLIKNADARNKTNCDALKAVVTVLLVLVISVAKPTMLYMILMRMNTTNFYTLP